MRFGSKKVPHRLVTLARNRMLATDTFTPAEVRAHLLLEAAKELQELSPIISNQQVVANRVVRMVINDLAADGVIAQRKRGLWAKTIFRSDANR